MTIKRKIVVIILISCLLILLSCGFLIYSFQKYNIQSFSDFTQLPKARVAIVFGAGYFKGGKPSRILQDRIDTAVRLYKAGIVQKVLFSGDNSTKTYNEPQTMFDEAERQGVPKQDMWRDFGGRDTYDTCFRAKEGWMVDEAILVTQAYHLPRALYCANEMGIKAYGFPADGPIPYRDINYYKLRELPAMALLLFELHILNRESEIKIQLQPEALQN